jgi:hypothetical protein
MPANKPRPASSCSICVSDPSELLENVMKAMGVEVGGGRSSTDVVSNPEIVRRYVAIGGSSLLFVHCIH